MKACIDHGYLGGPEGYALVSINRRQVGRHRVAYCDHHGLSIEEIAGKLVRHLCDNPRCVNPEHLSIGTVADNHRDRVGKGVVTKVLTDAEVIEMRSLYSGAYGQQLVLARRFGVNRTAAHRILKGSRR